MRSDLTSSSLYDLATEFRSGAKLTGTAYNLAQSPERFQDSPERTAPLARMQALGAELRSRVALDTFRELMADDDRDVRAWAAHQSLSLLPDLGSATLSGLLTGMTASEILALCARAKSKPPKNPPLSAMTAEALTARFEDASIREYGTRFVGDGDYPQDLKLRNRIVGEIWDIKTVLKRRGELERLLPLLDSDNITVRNEAARATLPIARERALKTLEAVVASHDTYEAPWASRAIESSEPGNNELGLPRKVQ